MNSQEASERCGWELTSEGGPWVAHLVWAIPTWLVKLWDHSILSSTMGRMCTFTIIDDIPGGEGKERRGEFARKGMKMEPVSHTTDSLI